MSALGQKQTYAVHKPMSLAPKSGHWAAQAICPNSIIIRSLTAGVWSLRCSPFLIFIPSDEDCDDRRAD